MKYALLAAAAGRAYGEALRAAGVFVGLIEGNSRAALHTTQQ